MRYGLTSVFAEPDVRRPSQAYSTFTEYNTRRPSQRLMYLQNALSGAANAQMEQPPTAYDRQLDHLYYVCSALHQPRATFEATPSNSHDLDFRKAFQVSSYSPERGNEGALVCVYLESTSDLISSTAQTANLMFASCPIPATWTRLEAAEQHACYKYSIHAIAPAFSETGSSALKIPLHLQFKDQSKLDASSIYIGDCIYEGDKHVEHRSSTQEASRKKVTDKLSGTLRSTERTRPSEHQITQSQNYPSYAHPSANLAYPQSLDFSTMQRRYTVYGRSELQQSLRNEADSAGMQGLLGGASTTQSAVRHSTAQTSLWTSPFGARYESASNLQPNTPSSFQVSSTSSQHPGYWRYIRLNRIQQPSRGTKSAGSSPHGSFSKYPLYHNRAVLETKRAVLEIRGNLDAMSCNWTPEEHSAERRVVRFWREIHGSTINVFFTPLRADEQGMPVEMGELRISCIYWEEENKHYVTSVDTISLLELVFDASHDIDEKNRIRRNLETYKPPTVSRSNCERFFELIMGFPNPKPSKIKKDVKVFTWSILEQALNKVVNKFVWAYLSRDLVSTDGPMTPRPRRKLNGALSAAGTRTRGSSATYSQTPESMILSPPSLPDGLPSCSQSSSSQEESSVSLAHSCTVPALGSQYMPNPTFNSPYTPQSSVPSLSPAWSTVSNMGRNISSQGSTEDLLTPTSDYYSTRPNTNPYYGSPFASQGLSEATATLGLPGRASEDLSAYLGQDVASSIGIGGTQYSRQSEMNDGLEATQFKEE